MRAMPHKRSYGDTVTLEELDYPVSASTDVVELRRENAVLRARLREREAECQRWALRWARDGLAARDLVPERP